MEVSQQPLRPTRKGQGWAWHTGHTARGLLRLWGPRCCHVCLRKDMEKLQFCPRGFPMWREAVPNP